MMNKVERSDLPLAKCDYMHVLEVIEELLKADFRQIETGDRSAYFSVALLKAAQEHGHAPLLSPTFDVDALASQIGARFTESHASPFEHQAETADAAISIPEFEKRKEFYRTIQTILHLMRKCLHAELQRSTPDGQPMSLHALMRNLVIRPGKIVPEHGEEKEAHLRRLLYEKLEETVELQKKSVVIGTKEARDPWLTGHRLTLAVKGVQNFFRQLVGGIQTHLERLRAKHAHVTEADMQRARDALHAMQLQEHSELQILKEAVLGQSIARIFRECQLLYLDYLLKRICTCEKIDTRNARLLEHLIVRLRALDSFSHKHDDAFYQVTLKREVYDTKRLLTLASAFDPLPVLPEIGGMLSEASLEGEKTFAVGVKLKLNSAVYTHGGSGESVYVYNMALLDAEAGLYKRRKESITYEKHFYEEVLRIALLYPVLYRLDDASFDVVAYLEEKVFPVLTTGTEEEKTALFKQIKEDIDRSGAMRNVQALRELLKEFMEQAPVEPDMCPQTLVLSLKETVLNHDLDTICTEQRFFRDVNLADQPETILKHIAVEQEGTCRNALCTLPLQVRFEPLHYYPADDEVKEYSVKYAWERLGMLPVLLIPPDKENEALQLALGDLNRVTLYYRKHGRRFGSEGAFAYRFAYLTLAYTFAKMLATYTKVADARRLFIPVICICDRKGGGHEYKENDAKKSIKEAGMYRLSEEEFVYSVARLLEFMLSQDHLSGSQSFQRVPIHGVDKGPCMSGDEHLSLSSMLPCVFSRKEPEQRSHQLKKLAVVQVTSCACNRTKAGRDDHSVSTLYGQVIGIERRSDGCLHLGPLTTFSTNMRHDEMFKRPHALFRQIEHCIARGYHHFLYIADAPYSRSLHISDVGSGPCFMSEGMIRALRELLYEENGKIARIWVYPIFGDTSYVVNRRGPQNPQNGYSLYVDEGGELVHRMGGGKVATFLHLCLDKNESKPFSYRNVTAYSTPLHLYKDDAIYERYIRDDLLHCGEQSPLRSELLEMLAMLHFWRFELNGWYRLYPDQKAIEIDSIGMQATYPGMRSGINFNGLAYLTEVRAALRMAEVRKKEAV
uniref:Uncharacterized protein n=1 Tax=Thermosporothrix sp. COM3 TaxID=2490863 RepID=A0A455SHY6_9CHLR|nr:hypothetical protein KTC_12900 [Thermosporothrix sp. COM3]